MSDFDAKDIERKNLMQLKERQQQALAVRAENEKRAQELLVRPFAPLAKTLIIDVAAAD